MTKLHILLIAFTLTVTTADKSHNISNIASIFKFNLYDTLIQISKNNEKSLKTICDKQFYEYVEQIFIKNWATNMFDASSKLPAGILKGNLYELGSYDQCLAIHAKTTDGSFQGKFCVGKIPLPPDFNKFTTDTSKFLRNVDAVGIAPNISPRDLLLPTDDLSLSMRFSFCIPSVCNATELQDYFNEVLQFFNLTADFVDTQCFIDKTEDFRAIDIFAIFILSTTIFLIILSTCYDIYLQRVKQKTNYPILLCFSIYTNGYHMFKIVPTFKNSGTLNSLMGIRFLSMAWIVYAHCYFISAGFPMFNYLDADKFVRSISGQLIVASSVTVDTFLVMSGLLVSYTLLRQFSHGIRLKDIPFIYIHRYIRITPPYAFMILLQVSIVKYFGSGALWNTTFNAMSSGCVKYWWTSLLYVQNYANPDTVCLGQSWYLSVDMQLFWIAPLLMMVIKKFKRFTYAIIGGIGIILTIITFVIAYENSLLGGMIAGTSNMLKLRKELNYEPTHTRAAPWVIGLALGYFLHEHRGKRIKMSWVVVTVGWMVSLGTILSVIFGQHPLMQKGYVQDPIGDPSYLAFSRPAWGLAIAWMILACENGYGGPIEWFLSLPMWQPLARLSYCEYLVHFVFQATVGGVARAPIYFTNFQMFYKLLSDLTCSMLFASLLSLTYESPMIIIEKTIFGKVKPKQETKEVLEEKNINIIVSTEEIENQNK